MRDVWCKRIPFNVVDSSTSINPGMTSCLYLSTHLQCPYLISHNEVDGLKHPPRPNSSSWNGPLSLRRVYVWPNMPRIWTKLLPCQQLFVSCLALASEDWWPLMIMSLRPVCGKLILIYPIKLLIPNLSMYLKDKCHQWYEHREVDVIPSFQCDGWASPLRQSELLDLLIKQQHTCCGVSSP